MTINIVLVFKNFLSQATVFHESERHENKQMQCTVEGVTEKRAMKNVLQEHKDRE